MGVPSHSLKWEQTYVRYGNEAEPCRRSRAGPSRSGSPLSTVRASGPSLRTEYPSAPFKNMPDYASGTLSVIIVNSFPSNLKYFWVPWWRPCLTLRYAWVCLCPTPKQGLSTPLFILWALRAPNHVKIEQAASGVMRSPGGTIILTDIQLKQY